MVLLSSKCRNPKMDLLCRVTMQKPENGFSVAMQKPPKDDPLSTNAEKMKKK
jgi:hypothetical protein